MSLERIMTKDIYVASPNDDLAYVRNLFIKKGISRVLIYDKKPIGMLTESDMTKGFFEERRSLDTLKVKDFMSKRLITVDFTEGPESIAKLLLQKGITGIPVTSGEDIIGIITRTDLVKYFAENYVGETAARGIMTKKVHTVKEFHSIFHAAKEMKEKGVGRLVVVRDNEIVGIISKRDISLASFGMKPSQVVFFRKGRSGMAHRNVSYYPLIIGDVMNANVVTASPDEDAAKIAGKMLKKNVGSVVLTTDNFIDGIITKTNYLEYLAGKS